MEDVEAVEKLRDIAGLAADLADNFGRYSRDALKIKIAYLRHWLEEVSEKTTADVAS